MTRALFCLVVKMILLMKRLLSALYRKLIKDSMRNLIRIYRREAVNYTKAFLLGKESQEVREEERDEGSLNWPIITTLTAANQFK